MGFINSIFSIFRKNTYRGICRAMIRSYKKVKKLNPGLPRRDLYALALSLRPFWKRISPSSFTFRKGSEELTIEENDTFRDVVRNLIILKTRPGSAFNPVPSDVMSDYLLEVIQVIDEEFKELKE